MFTERTAWHVLLYQLLKERAPKAYEVRPEVPLAGEPQRPDFLLLRRQHDAPVDDAQVLRGLWPRLRLDALLEYKSVSAPLRRGDLCRLVGYGAQYATQEHKRLECCERLTLGLVVAGPTPTLSQELAFVQARLEPSQGGYAPITGLIFPAFGIFLDEVSETERDGLLALFGHGGQEDAVARAWLRRHVWTGGEPMSETNLEELAGYEEVIEKALQGLPPELRLKGLAPEQRLAGLAPEQRLAGLAPEQRLAGLTEEEKEELRQLLEKPAV
jgi:hypothetical protein